MLYRISNLKKFFLFVLLLIIMVNQSVQANPSGGQVTAGVAQIVKTSPQRLDIIQQSQRAALNWRSFNINANEHVNFQQPSAQSSALNRISGQDPSRIFGKLTANGKVFLLNPNGILFGKQAKVDVGSLVATTANIKDADFMAGRLQFDGKVNNASIVNLGQINAKDNGLVTLVAPGVNNSGVINAKLARVALASGRKFALDLYGDNLIKLAVDDGVVDQMQGTNGQPGKVFVNHSGVINAEGGQVILAAGTAKQAVDHVVNMNGVIRAQSASQHNGQIILSAGSQGKVQVNGLLDASGLKPGQTGGTIQVLGKQVNLGGKANLNASGQSGGGNIHVGGDYQGKGQLLAAQTTQVNQGSRLHADALNQGNGGKVIVWADGTTRFNGNISAKGGSKSGNGGFAEVSGKNNLIYRGDTVLSARHGKAGTLLLDPANITVGTSGSNTLNTNDSTIKASTISETLGKGTSVKLLASNDISVNADIDSRYQDAPAGAGLNLDAGNNVNLNANILTKNGTITAKASNGNITMAKNKILFAGNQDITLTAGKNINAQHLVTSGDVKLTANTGNVELKQALGGALDKNGKPLFRLAALTVTANQGEVRLNGIDATSDVKVSALKNIDVNGPINTSGGGITLTSHGSNTTQTAINLNHNLYTNGKDIILDGDVLLNPTAKELIAELKEKKLSDDFITGCNVITCKPVFCPECEVKISDTDQTQKFLVIDTNFKRFKFLFLDNFPPIIKDERGKILATGFDPVNQSSNNIFEVNRRLDAFKKLLSIRNISIQSNGGNIIFKGKLDRFVGDSFNNYKKATDITNFPDNTGANPNVFGTGSNGIVDKYDGVMFDSFMHHGLTLSANNGEIHFEKEIGNFISHDISNKSSLDRGVGALGKFVLSIPSAKQVLFKDNIYLNGLNFKNKFIESEDLKENKLLDLKHSNPTKNIFISSINYTLEQTKTSYRESTQSPNKVDYSGLGGVKLGLLPLRNSNLGSNGGGNGGSNGGGGSGGGSSGSGGGSGATANSVLSQVQVAQRNETCKKSARQDNKELFKTAAKSDAALNPAISVPGKIANKADKQAAVNSDCGQKVNDVKAAVASPPVS